MPRGDGTGPSGTGRRNQRNGSFGSNERCYQNNRSSKNRSANNKGTTDNNQSNWVSSGKSDPLFSIATTLIGIAMAAIPAVVKFKNLLTHNAPKEVESSEQDYPNTIILKPESVTTVKAEKNKNKP